MTYSCITVSSVVEVRKHIHPDQNSVEEVNLTVVLSDSLIQIYNHDSSRIQEIPVVSQTKFRQFETYNVWKGRFVHDIRKQWIIFYDLDNQATCYLVR